MTHCLNCLLGVSLATKAAVPALLHPGMYRLCLSVSWVSLSVYPEATENNLTPTQMCTINEVH